MSALAEKVAEHDGVAPPGNIQFLQKRDRDEDLDAAGGERRWPGWPGDSVFRILVPWQKVGALIGRKGEVIKKMCEESRARIKIIDGPPGSLTRVVMISAKEEPDASVPPAIDGLLRVHKRVIDGLDAESAHAAGAGGSASTRLLVAATQAGILIGKHGATIKSIQEASKCIVRVVEDLPSFALQDDRIVEIQGEPAGVHKALELIAGHLRKFLVDRSVLPLFEMHSSMPNAHVGQNIPPPQPWGQGLPPNAGGAGFGGTPPFMPPRMHDDPPFMPPRMHDDFYPPPDIPPMEKPPHLGVSAYGREAPPMGIHSSTNQPQPPIMTVTQHMQIPLSYADAVIGTAGASISYIRRASGATITIQETRGAPGEMTVEINGSATQVQTAQQLIQNFMAEAAGSAKNKATSLDQGYNAYQTHGSAYGSAPASGGPAAHGGGSYGSVYGNSYGY